MQSAAVPEIEIETTPTVPIIDSHIHLYPASELSTLAWCKPGNPIGTQHSLHDYEKATHAPPALRGFVFLETDRTHDLEAGAADGSGWTYPLMEVAWLRRIALGTPRAGEGHEAHQKDLCLAVVPWAPLPSGVEVLERYVERVREEAGESWGRIRGWRYLVQDKPPGAMLGEGFVEGLKWLGRKGWAFDLGIDQHSGGDGQLDEAVEMMRRAHEGVAEEEKVVVVINHLCKPDMTLSTEEDFTETPQFIKWRDSIVKLSRFSKTYMKLSGCFSEMPATLSDASPEEIFFAMQPWFSVVVGAFGSSRIMFGSDWPVCTIGVPQDAWEKWRIIVQRMCQVEKLTRDQERMLWGGTAIQAYGIKELA